MTPEQLDIMRHTATRAAGGLYCGDSPELQQLVAEGLMRCIGKKSFVPDSYFALTEKGRELLSKEAKP